jgi:hypothetical protein
MNHMNRIECRRLTDIGTGSLVIVDRFEGAVLLRRSL